MKEENIILNKSYKFALRIIKLYLHMTRKLKEYELSKQILRCGTSIGANVEEAIGGHSKKEFLSKMNIAYKEAREVNYFLRLLRDSEFIGLKLASSFIIDSEELIKILTQIQLTTKQNLSK